MEPRIDVIGIGADGAAGLRPELVERVLAADFLAGGERHLGYFPEARGERFVIRDNLGDCFVELSRRFPSQHCAVLASGDPLFYGIGSYLYGLLGPTCLRVEPAVSSMQLAFARVGIPWQYAELASVHGRDLRLTLLPLLGKRYVGLFTQDGDSPAAVARFFLDHGLNDYEAVVAENLGTADERLTRWANLQELAGQRFAPLNYLILQDEVRLRDVGLRQAYRDLAPGIPDDAFARPSSGPPVMTCQEVRTVIIGKLLSYLAVGDTVWDLGAGLGTVSVEVAVLRPHVEVVAVERDPSRVALLRANREHFRAYNIRVVEGSAPQALQQETERPRLVFVGGSGGRLAEILDLVAERLLDRGRLVVALVTLEHLLTSLERVKGWGWPWDVTEVHVARSDSLGGLTGLRPQRGVFVLRAERPAPAATGGGLRHE
jgi:precorrin-6Y C5,15-methyltransferase (decarboxylating)